VRTKESFCTRMASYTTLVNVHVETALKVSAFVAKRLQAGGDKFEEDCKAAINTQNTAQLVKLFVANEEAIYGLDSDEGTLMHSIATGSIF
jgi:hypothetical protein